MLRGQELRTELRRIIRIGRTGECGNEELLHFLPELQLGSGFIYGLDWEMVRGHLGRDVVPFIKGLHLIEEAYKKETGNSFGFGSPCPAQRMLDHMRYQAQQVNKDADDLTEWIRNNGGNYYIKKARP